QHQVALLVRRHLAERLEATIGCGLLVFRTDHPLRIGFARLFERPTHSQITYQALGERRNCTENADSDRGHVGIPRSGTSIPMTIQAAAVLQTMTHSFPSFD